MKKTLGIFFSLIILININSLAKEKVTIAIEDNDFAPWTFGKKSKFKGQGAYHKLEKTKSMVYLMPALKKKDKKWVPTRSSEANSVK